MIIMQSAVFGCMGIIIFQLTEWIAIVTKSSKAVLKEWKYCNDVLGFLYLAIPTRHEVPRVPHLHEHNLIKKTNP